MKNKIREIGKIAGMFLMLVFAVCVMPMGKVKASPLELTNNFTKVYWIGSEEYRNASRNRTNVHSFRYLYLNGKKIKNLKVTSSNKSVVKVQWENGEYPTIRFIPKKKTGTSKITVTAKVNGKKITYRGKVIVAKFTNPFKSFKLNGREYALRLNVSRIEANDIMIPVPKNLTKVPFSYKLNKGWKIEKVEYYYYQYPSKTKIIPRRIVSNYQIPFKLSGGYEFSSLCLTLRDQATKEKFFVFIDYDYELTIRMS